MRLTQKKIEGIITDILGEEGLLLLKHLFGKENISEFDLADLTKEDIKVVRRQLYLLYNHNLVGFTRKKDKQKGWYVYYWTLLPDSIRFNYIKKKKILLERLKFRLGQEEKELFFICPNDCVRLNFDGAIDFEFHCPECGQLISQDSNEDKIKFLRAQIGNIEGELEKIRKGEEEKKRLRIIAEKKRLIEEKKQALIEAKLAAKLKADKLKAKKKPKKKAKKKPAKKIVVKTKPAKKKAMPTKKKVVKKKSVKKKVVKKKKK